MNDRPASANAGANRPGAAVVCAGRALKLLNQSGAKGLLAANAYAERIG